MGEYIEIFDFKKIFIDYFLGSVELFIFALLLLISLGCAKFGVSTRNFMIILVTSSIIFAGYLGNAIYFLILITVGFISFKTLARIFT